MAKAQPKTSYKAKMIDISKKKKEANIENGFKEFFFPSSEVEIF